MPKNKTFKRIVQDKKESPGPESVPVEFDIDGSLGKYISFIENLRVALANHKDPESMSCIQKSEWRKPHILLPKQIAPGPARWIEIKLSAGEHNTTLFVRDDNVYLVGFENKNKKRYQAGKGMGRGGQSSRAPNKNGNMPDQILEDATPLGYDLSYRDLGGDNSKWKLGIFDARKAVRKLSAYGTEENSNKPHECIRQYLVTLIVMICETARMCRIMKRVKEGWSSEGIVHFSPDKEKGSVHLNTIERETLNEWEHMSQAMMRWGDYTPGLKKIKVRNDKEAGDVVRLIKYAPTVRKVDTAPGGDDPSHPSPGGGGNGDGGDDPSDTSPGDVPPADAPGDGNGDAQRGDGNGDGAPPGGGSGDGTSPGGGNGDPPPADRNGKNLQHAPEGNDKSQQRRQQQGRSLVEMFSIHLAEGCTLPDVSSITVFDGKRGQIIYWNEEDGDAPRVDSKGDLVLTGPYRAISAGGRVALRIITTVSDSDTEEDDLLIWDPYTEDAHEDIDELVSGDIAKDLTLTYAVLRSAVEATVQVDLFLFKDTDFFGEITVQSKLTRQDEKVNVVLFSREIKDRVVLQPSSAGSTIPLTRSVLAWAVGSKLLIKVVCFHSVSVSHCGLRLRPNVGRSFYGEPSLESLELSFFEDHTNRLHVATLEGFGLIRVSVDDTGEYREKTNNSLPRSLMNQMSHDQILAAEQNAYFTRMGILECEPAAQDPKDIRTRSKLLAVRTSHPRFITLEGKWFITCLLDVTNHSDDQHVAFRCRSVLERIVPYIESPIIRSSAPKWELSGIVPPNSTSTHFVRSESNRWESDTLSLILESCAASHDDKHMDTILAAARVAREKALANETSTSEQAEDDVSLDTIFRAYKERIEKVTLKVTVRDPADKTTTYVHQAVGNEDLHTFFSRPSNGIKEVTIKATVSHHADVPVTSETEIKVPIAESSINQNDLDVYPLQLRFPLEQDKVTSAHWVTCCPLRLTNRTNDYIIFKCLPLAPNSYLYTLDHLNGIVPPMSTCAYVVVAMEKQKDLPDNMDALSVILKSCTAEKITGPDKYIFRQDPMHGRIPPRIEIITVTRKAYIIMSMDVHPTEPWILASHNNGNISIWNYQTQERVMELKNVSHFDVGYMKRLIWSAKFIAREKWIVAGSGGGLIYVVTYTTNTEVSNFEAHKDSVRSLAVHPNQPIVLSATIDETIMLWNWDVNRNPIWQRTRTFSGHTNSVNHVMFNPYDNGNTFASASHDCTVKIWRTNDPNDQPKQPIATLDCGQDTQLHVAYFSMGDRQYMITGSTKGAARVWDLKDTNRPIKELDGPESDVLVCNVGVISCVPDNTNPVLITVSRDKGISFLDAATYESRYDTVNFGLGEPKGFASVEVKGKRSLAIAFEFGIAIMEMNEDPVNSPATLEQAQEGTYSAESSKEQ